MCSPRERRIRLVLQEEFLRRGRFAPRHRLCGWLLVLHCAADCPWRRRYARNCPRPLRIDSIGVRVRPRGQFAAVCHLAIVSAASLRFRRQHPRLVNLVEAERTRRHWRHSAVLKSAGQSPIGLLPLDNRSTTSTSGFIVGRNVCNRFLQHSASERVSEHEYRFPECPDGRMR